MTRFQRACAAAVVHLSSADTARLSQLFGSLNASSLSLMTCQPDATTLTLRGRPFAQLAENLRLLRECRFANLSTLESLEALGQLSEPPISDDAPSASEDPSGHGTQSERDAADDGRAAQRAVLTALRLTQEQIAAVLEVSNPQYRLTCILKAFTLTAHCKRNSCSCCRRACSLSATALWQSCNT